MTPTDTAPLALWRLPKVLEVTGEKKSTFLQKVHDGAAPKPVKLGQRAVAWYAPEVVAYVKQFVAQRDAAR